MKQLEHFVEKEELTQIFISLLTKALQTCDDQVGITIGHKDRLRHVVFHTFPTTHLSSKDFPLKETDWIKGEDAARKNDRIKESIKRWHHIATKTSRRRENEMVEKQLSAEKEVHGAVVAWSGGVLPVNSFPIETNLIDPKLVVF